MKTAFKKIGQQIELREVNPRKLERGEVRIDVECCGICGFDLHGGTPEGEMRFSSPLGQHFIERLV